MQEWGTLSQWNTKRSQGSKPPSSAHVCKAVLMLHVCVGVCLCLWASVCIYSMYACIGVFLYVKLRVSVLYCKYQKAIPTSLLREYYLLFTDQLEMSCWPFSRWKIGTQTSKVLLKPQYCHFFNYPLAANWLFKENIRLTERSLNITHYFPKVPSEVAWQVMRRVVTTALTYNQSHKHTRHSFAYINVPTEQ